MMRKSSYLFFLLLLCSCGYRWSIDFPEGKRPTIAVPYAVGDEDGTFTAEVIRSLTSFGLVNVSQNEPDYHLIINITGLEDHTVGYRYDKQKVSGEIKKNIVADEGRRSMSAIVTLMKTGDKSPFAGPYTITADSDYDYVDGDSIQDLAFINSFGQRTTALAFSLGQLEPKEAAQEATTKPLFQKLAQKIADVFFSVW